MADVQDDRIRRLLNRPCQVTRPNVADFKRFDNRCIG